MRFLLTTAAVTAVTLGAAAAPAAAGVFHTPSKNIACAVEKYGVRCDIARKTWSPPPKPRSCRLDWGNGLGLPKNGRAFITCAGDTLIGSGRVLAYGSSMSKGRFRCTSRRSGVRCVNTDSGRGFTLSKQAYTRF